MQIFSYIPKFLGLILNFIYQNLSFGRYGLAIVIFTIFIKFLLLPLTIKQFKSNAQLQKIQPIIQEIQRKYKNDTTKLNEEMMKVYSEHKYNPASGCLPLLVQLPILFSLMYVIGKPMTYMFNYSSAQIANYIDIYKKTTLIPDNLKITGFYEQIGAVDFHQLLNMKFFGLNLGLVPSVDPGKLFGNEMAIYLPLLLLPILSVATTFLSNKLMMQSTIKKNNNNDGKPDAAAAMQKNMMFIAPIMTLMVSFQFPAGLGLYWLVGNVFQIFQQLYLNKYVINKKEVSDK